MKKLFSVLLAAVMLFCMTGPAFAAEADPPPVEDEQPPAAETISTADRLKAALAAADDGDTVTISQTIIVTDESLITDKHITIALADDFTDINGVSTPTRKCRFTPKRDVIFRRTVYKCIQP